MCQVYCALPQTSSLDPYSETENSDTTAHWNTGGRHGTHPPTFFCDYCELCVKRELANKRAHRVLGLDDTIERRRGEQIKAKGIYRDPGRSSHSHFVKVSGLRWLASMVLTPLTGVNRVWALPFLTVLCPSERFYEPQGRRHHTVTERAWQMIRLVVRWLPEREIVFVADSSFAVLDLLDKVKLRAVKRPNAT